MIEAYLVLFVYILGVFGGVFITLNKNPTTILLNNNKELKENIERGDLMVERSTLLNRLHNIDEELEELDNSSLNTKLNDKRY